jgi:hypothetical protein
MIIFFFSVKFPIMSAQHGFFKGRSTVPNLIEFTSYVLNCMENGEQVDAIYIYVLISPRRLTRSAMAAVEKTG